jgi:hypothetical protein
LRMKSGNSGRLCWTGRWSYLITKRTVKSMTCRPRSRTPPW